MKFCRILAYGIKDEADLPFQTAVEEFMGTTVVDSAIATLDDLGFTREQINNMDAPEVR